MLTVITFFNFLHFFAAYAELHTWQRIAAFFRYFVVTLGAESC